MKSSRVIILILALTAVLAISSQYCAGDQKDEQNIFKEDENMGPGPGPGPRRGPGRGRFELTDEEVDHILKDLQERSPEKAKELTELRKTDPDKFRDELRRQAREEFGKVVRERIDKWRQQRQTEFLEWLAKSMPNEADELAKLKNRDPDLYGKKYEQSWRNYGRIFEESRRSPELSEILLDDFKLQKRTEELTAKIKAARNEKEKKKLNAELQEVVGLRYDLIVRKKQLAYEWLLKRLEELQNHVKESRAELSIWQDPKTKADNVKERVDYLLQEKKGFDWH